MVTMSILVVGSERVNLTPKKLFKTLFCLKWFLNTFNESLKVLKSLPQKFFDIVLTCSLPSVFLQMHNVTSKKTEFFAIKRHVHAVNKSSKTSNHFS